jgi:hypothetical protein
MLDSQKVRKSKNLNHILSHNANTSRWFLKALWSVVTVLLTVCGFWVNSFYTEFQALEGEVDTLKYQVEELAIEMKMIMHPIEIKGYTNA